MTKEEQKYAEASLDSTELEKLATRMKRVFDIRDRKYGFPPKTYKKRTKF